MSLRQQALENEYAWLEGSIRAATEAGVDGTELAALSSTDLDRVVADRWFAYTLRVLNALKVGSTAKSLQNYFEDQRIRRDLSIAGTGHRELAKGLMTLKLRRFNHIGRLLGRDSDLSPKTDESGDKEDGK